MTDTTPYSLRPDVQIEPLFDNWYMWAHLVPPHTAARNITGRHLKIMDSYISAPMLHAQACKNPKMLGGPFIAYDGKRVDEIQALRNRTQRERADLIALSAAFDELDALLLASAKGFSLHPLYKNIPDALKGYVELVYDLGHQPSFRVIEPLMYWRYFDKSLFSFAFSRTTGDDRPFVLSTPRLPANDMLQLPIAPDSPALDWLFKLKKIPQPWGAIKETLEIPDEADSLFQTFLGTEPERPYEPYTGNGVRWRYFGHACILIETCGLSFLIDPVLSYTYETDISRYTYQDLPDRIDYVLITHNHQDHILFETLFQLRSRIGQIIVPRAGSGAMQDPSVKLLLNAMGFDRVIEMGEMEEMKLEGCSVTGLPFFGEHADLDVRAKLAWLLRVGRHSLMFAADSCNIEPRVYEHLHTIVGDVDALFVGMECDGAPLTWLYGPLLVRHIERAQDESRRFSGSNYEQALDIVNRFHCKEVYVYAMGQEPWLNHIMSIKYTAESRPITESNKLIEDCRSRGIISERLFGEKEILIEP
jgi:L-ascorbate metabolism protein UlaG (beta-lactamase superfamily)